MVGYINELVKSRELLFTWSMREFKVRYSQSIMGAAWAIMQPLALMIIFSLVFSLFLEVPTDGIPYPIFAYTALLPWTFFSSALTFAIPSLVNNMNLVSKIHFPREILPLAAIMVAFVDFVIASSIFVMMMIFYQIPLNWTLLYIPLVLLIQIVLTFGVCLLASAFMVFFRDVRFLIPLVLQIWLYLSPVIYSTNMVPESLRALYFLNPMAAIIDTYRRIILFGQQPEWGYLALASVVSLLLLIAAYHYFKNAERQFADLI